MVFQAMPLFLSLRNQIAPILFRPPRVVEGVRGKEVGPDAPLLMATYTEAANKFTKAAMEIMEYAHRLTGRGMLASYGRRSVSLYGCGEK